MKGISEGACLIDPYCVFQSALHPKVKGISFTVFSTFHHLGFNPPFTQRWRELKNLTTDLPKHHCFNPPFTQRWREFMSGFILPYDDGDVSIRPSPKGEGNLVRDQTSELRHVGFNPPFTQRWRELTITILISPQVASFNPPFTQRWRELVNQIPGRSYLYRFNPPFTQRWRELIKTDNVKFEITSVSIRPSPKGEGNLHLCQHPKLHN